MLLLLLAVASAAAETPNSCVDCHRLLPDRLGAPVAEIAADVHVRRGLSCSDCHGGDPADPSPMAMSPDKGFRRGLARTDIPGLCGRCHGDESIMRKFNPELPTDQESQYWTSVHGQRLRQGDGKVATCIDCHGVHPVLSPKQADSPVFPANVPRTCARCHADAAYMKEYGIPTEQFAQYQKSAHGIRLLVKRDLAAAACNDCHGNHGAYPPQADSVSAVCGQCHVVNREYFEKGPHRAAFAGLGLSDCVTCHGKHEISPEVSDDMLGIGEVSVCVTCHRPGSAGYRTAGVLRERLEALRKKIEHGEDVLERAERAGMEVGKAKYEFQAARQALVEARNVTHAVSVEELDVVVKRGEEIADASIRRGTEALEDLASRRRTVFIPLALIGVVMGLLYVKMRRIERR